MSGVFLLEQKELEESILRLFFVLCSWLCRGTRICYQATRSHHEVQIDLAKTDDHRFAAVLCPRLVSGATTNSYQHAFHWIFSIADLDRARSGLFSPRGSRCRADLDAIKFVGHSSSGGRGRCNFRHSAGSAKFIELQEPAEFCLFCRMGELERALDGR